MEVLGSNARKRPRVGLVGFFGWGNYGDELLLQFWRRVLTPYFEIAPVNDLLAPPYLSAAADDVAQRHDAFVIGGGDLVIPNAVSKLYWKREWLARKVYICGVGVALWRHKQVAEVIDEMAAFFQHPNVQYISARDEQSAAWIRERLQPRVPVVVHPDLAFGLPLPSPREPTADARRTLGISVRQGPYSRDNDFSALARLVERARAQNYAIQVLELGSGRQRRRDQRAIRQMPFTPDSVVSSSNVNEISAAIGALDSFATMKFHGLVIALMYGVPALGLVPNTKNVNLLSAIDRPDLIGDLDSEVDLACKLNRLQVPIDHAPVAVLQQQLHAAVGDLVRQMRIQLAPSQLWPSTPSEAGDLIRRVLPDAVRLARRERRVARQGSTGDIADIADIPANAAHRLAGGWTAGVGSCN